MTTNAECPSCNQKLEAYRENLESNGWSQLEIYSMVKKQKRKYSGQNLIVNFDAIMNEDFKLQFNYNCSCSDCGYEYSTTIELDTK